MNFNVVLLCTHNLFRKFGGMKSHETIDFHIRWVWAKISRMYNQEAAKHGGTMSIGYILLNIEKEGTHSTKLGPKMGMEARSLTRTLKTMEDDGLIFRETDPKDRRKVRVFLTQKGKKMRERSKETVLAFNSLVRERITPEELENCIHVLQQLNGLLDEMRNENESTNHSNPIADV